MASQQIFRKEEHTKVEIPIEEHEHKKEVPVEKHVHTRIEIPIVEHKETKTRESYADKAKSEERSRSGETEGNKQLSLEEISKLRGQAQQTSNDAIMAAQQRDAQLQAAKLAAEERFAQAQQSRSHEHGGVESGRVHGAGKDVGRKHGVEKQGQGVEGERVHGAEKQSRGGVHGGGVHGTEKESMGRERVEKQGRGHGGEGEHMRWVEKQGQGVHGAEKESISRGQGPEKQGREGVQGGQKESMSREQGGEKRGQGGVHGAEKEFMSRGQGAEKESMGREQGLERQGRGHVGEGVPMDWAEEQGQGGVHGPKKESMRQGHGAEKQGRGDVHGPEKESMGREQGRKEVGTTLEETKREKKQHGVEEERPRQAVGVGATVKDTLMSAGKTAADYTGKATNYATEKASQAQRDYTPVVQEKAAAAKDTTVDVTKRVAGYTGEKAVAAKDVAVESTKNAAGYAGEVAADVKDKAVAAGWSAAHYSADKAVQGTKAAARAVEGVAGYAGDTVLAAGQVAADIAAKPLSLAKDVAVSAGETVKDYSARKKEEAERELEAKRTYQTQATGEEFQQQGAYVGEGRDFATEGKQTVKEGGGDFTGKEKHWTAEEESKDFPREVPETILTVAQGAAETLTRPVENITHTLQGEGVPIKQEPREVKEGGGVLGAIGETIAEIAQTTTNMVAGPQGRSGELGQGHEATTTETKTKQ